MSSNAKFPMVTWKPSVTSFDLELYTDTGGGLSLDSTITVSATTADYGWSDDTSGVAQSDSLAEHFGSAVSGAANISAVTTTYRSDDTDPHPQARWDFEFSTSPTAVEIRLASGAAGLNQYGLREANSVPAKIELSDLGGDVWRLETNANMAGWWCPNRAGAFDLPMNTRNIATARSPFSPATTSTITLSSYVMRRISWPNVDGRYVNSRYRNTQIYESQSGYPLDSTRVEDDDHNSLDQLIDARLDELDMRVYTAAGEYQDVVMVLPIQTGTISTDDLASVASVGGRRFDVDLEFVEA